jgi:hypothetical protein
MGLFEYCERLLEQGLLNQTDFDRNLRYRLTNIVAWGSCNEGIRCKPRRPGFVPLAGSIHFRGQLIPA